MNEIKRINKYFNDESQFKIKEKISKLTTSFKTEV